MREGEGVGPVKLVEEAEVEELQTALVELLEEHVPLLEEEE